MNVATTNAVVTAHTHTMEGDLARRDVEIVSLLESVRSRNATSLTDGTGRSLVNYFIGFLISEGAVELPSS
jgi:hypothetical protein